MIFFVDPGFFFPNPQPGRNSTFIILHLLGPVGNDKKSMPEIYRRETAGTAAKRSGTENARTPERRIKKAIIPANRLFGIEN